MYNGGSTEPPVGKQEGPGQCEERVSGGKAPVHHQVELYVVFYSVPCDVHPRGGRPADIKSLMGEYRLSMS